MVRLLRSFGALVLTLFLPWSAAAAQESGSASAPAGETYTLANGLEVVLAPRPGSGRVAVVVRYEAGSRDDPDGFRGLALLTQQVAIQARLPARVPYDLFPFVPEGTASGAGAQLTRDFSYFYADMPASQLDMALWFEATRMASLLAHADEWALERARAAVRRNLQGSALEGAARPFLRVISESLYPAGHPYRAAFDGAQDLDELELVHVRWFFQRRYGPRSARVYVVGDFALANVKPAVQRAFGGIRGSVLQQPRSPAAPARLAGEHLVRIVENQWARTCMLAWPTAAQGSDDDRALHSLARTLTDRLERSSSGRPDFERRNHARLLAGERESLFLVIVDLPVDVHPKFLLGEIDTLLESARRGGAAALPAWAQRDDAAGGVLEQAQRLAGLLPDSGVRSPDAMAAAARTWLPADRRVMICSQPDSSGESGEVTMHEIREARSAQP
jgi:zinc protease